MGVESCEGSWLPANPRGRLEQRFAGKFAEQAKSGSGPLTALGMTVGGSG
jgi:hypothetical protein